MGVILRKGLVSFLISRRIIAVMFIKAYFEREKFILAKKQL